MDKLIQKGSDKLNEWIKNFKNKRSVQYGTIVIYLLLWLFTSGSLSTTIWVGIGILLGWIVGKSDIKNE